METLHERRKNDHVVEALKQYTSTPSSEFDRTRFVHHSLTQTTFDDVSIETTLQQLTLSMPFFINAITGGSSQTNPINDKLALVAHETGIAMATGSNSIAIKDPSTQEGFKKLRKTNPNGLIFANLGAHHTVENAKIAVDLLRADALQLHLNTPQEMVMPEGDRDFSNWLNNIATIIRTLNIPIIVKEVGFGMSHETMALLQQAGVSIIDISGRNGTNFVGIENARRPQKEYDMLFDWGQTTIESLLEAKALPTKPTLIASGGIKNALDIAKAIALGANAVGLSGHFLYCIQKHGVQYTIEHIYQMQDQLKTVMTLLNAKNIHQLQKAQLILPPEIIHWAQQRQLPL